MVDKFRPGVKYRSFTQQTTFVIIAVEASLERQSGRNHAPLTYQLYMCPFSSSVGAACCDRVFGRMGKSFFVVPKAGNIGLMYLASCCNRVDRDYLNHESAAGWIFPKFSRWKVQRRLVRASNRVSPRR